MITAIIQIALAISVSPLDVCAVIAYETHGTFSTSIKSPIGATGLIQFTDATAESLGTTTDKLSKMTFDEQAKYVTRYFKQRKFVAMQDGYDLHRMYSAVFCGNTNYKKCMKKSDGYNKFSDIIDHEIKFYKHKCRSIFK